MAVTGPGGRGVLGEAGTGTWLGESEVKLGTGVGFPPRRRQKSGGGGGEASRLSLPSWELEAGKSQRWYLTLPL